VTPAAISLLMIHLRKGGHKAFDRDATAKASAEPQSAE
jgi:tRNA uridine 5-carboxymethylaminomethyl modification enzyme